MELFTQRAAPPVHNFRVPGEVTRSPFGYVRRSPLGFVRPCRNRNTTLQPLVSLPQDLPVEPMASVIDGKSIAHDIRNEIAAEVTRMEDALGKVPGLGVVIVGGRKDSETYLRSMKKDCEERHCAVVNTVDKYTKNPKDITREADIIISAAGVANLLHGDWLKPGAVVIDVGINAVEDPNSKRGYRLVGDVCYDEASREASAITPVPGGVGPMTTAMLLFNTLDSAKRAYGFS